MHSVVLEGDCVQVMREMDEASVDAIVCDPPYGLEFMGKHWDAPWKRGEGIGEHNAGFKPGAPAEKGVRGAIKALPNYTGSTNPTCRNCGGTKHGKDRKSRKVCKCGSKDFPNTTLPRMRAFQEWTEAWATEAIRVLKPGGFLLAFGGTRTYHRMTCAIEDAGFEIRDCIQWIYGSGFPKSKSMRDIDRPELGTALKPAHEPIVMARRPLSESSVARNVLEHGTGAINIDGCRVGNGSDRTNGGIRKSEHEGDETIYSPWGNQEERPTGGRFPSNTFLSHIPGPNGCRPTGEIRRVKKPGGNGSASKNTHNTDASVTWDAGQEGKPRKWTSHYNPDGTEEVAEYLCHPECPVFLMDQMSGQLKNGGHAAGRWPSNLWLSHSEGCRPTGEMKRVKGEKERGLTDTPARSWKNTSKAGINRTGHANPDGTEEVAEWICVEGCPVALLDQQGHKMGAHSAGNKTAKVNHQTGNEVYAGEWAPQDNNPDYYNSDGGSNVSRFFQQFHPDTHPGFQYVPKSSRRERNLGLEGMPEKLNQGSGTHSNGQGKTRLGNQAERAAGQNKVPLKTTTNGHPTVKPLGLMRYLVRLITPPGGTVLDCFCGSGSTGAAAVQEGFNFIGIEAESEYAEIARKRIAYWSQPEEVRARDKSKLPPRTGPVTTSYSLPSRECLECGSRAKNAGGGEPWPNCGHGNWQWVEQGPKAKPGKVQSSNQVETLSTLF